MLRDRINNIAILHIYHDMIDKVDIEKLLDKFITQNSERSTVFALGRKWSYNTI